MIGVKIRAKLQLKSGEPRLRSDLEEILAVIGERIITSRWRCRDLWCLMLDDSAHKANMKLSGKELLKFASNVRQTIDGRFEARSEGAAKHP